MRKKIQLKQTRYYTHYLKKMCTGKNGDIYKLYTNHTSSVRKSKEGYYNTIMLAGGPKIVEQQSLPNYPEYQVLQITYTQGNYYLIIKENSNEKNN